MSSMSDEQLNGVQKSGIMCRKHRRYIKIYERFVDHNFQLGSVQKLVTF